MNYQELYSQTISKLKKNERPLIKLTPELILELKSEWTNAISTSVIDESALKKILCILDNTQNTSAQFSEQFIETFEKVFEKNLLIYCLSASQKHVVNEAFRTGNMIPIIYFEKLKCLLQNDNPEIVEWTLRTIETLGPLSLRMIKEVREVKFGFFNFLNQHQRASLQIISLMEKQWEKMRL